MALRNLRSSGEYAELAGVIRAYAFGRRLFYAPNVGNWGDALVHFGSPVPASPPNPACLRPTCSTASHEDQDPVTSTPDATSAGYGSPVLSDAHSQSFPEAERKLNRSCHQGHRRCNPCRLGNGPRQTHSALRHLLLRLTWQALPIILYPRVRAECEKVLQAKRHWRDEQ